MILLTCNIKKNICFYEGNFIETEGNFIETESRLNVTRAGEGRGSTELLLNGYGVSVWDDENVLEIVVIAAQHCDHT